MGDTSFVKYNHRILSINKGNTPDVLTENITVPSFRGYSAGEVIPAGTKLIDIINKEFKSPAPTHNVTITVVGSGTTSPAAGSHSVIEGNSFTMTSATPASGWNLDSVKLDGASVTLPYVIPNVTGDKTFVVTFVQPAPTPKYTITTSAGTGGTITPTFEVEEGQQADVTITPNTGYKIKSITRDGTPEAIIIPTSAQTVMIANVHEPHTVTAEFEPVAAEVYHVVVTNNTPSSLSGAGTISPTVGSHDVAVGTDTTVTVTPNAGFRVKTFTVDGSAVTSPYTITGIAVDATVNVVVEFEEVSLSIVESFIRSTRSGAIVDPTPENIAGDAVVTNKTQAELDDMVANNYQWEVNAPANYCIPVFMYPTTMPDIANIEYLDGDPQAFTKGSMTYNGVEYKWIRWNNKMNSGLSPRVIMWS